MAQLQGACGEGAGDRERDEAAIPEEDVARPAAATLTQARKHDADQPPGKRREYEGGDHHEGRGLAEGAEVAAAEEERQDQDELTALRASTMSRARVRAPDWLR